MKTRTQRRPSQSPNYLITQSPRLLRGVRIAIIGTGTMGQALIRGLLRAGISRARLRAADPSASMRRLAARRFGVQVSADNAQAIRGSGVVLLAVKPQQMADVVAQLAPRLSRHQLVISIAAGVTLRWLQVRLPKVAIIRVMPNLPATVSVGFSAITPGSAATSRHRTMARALFGAVGEVVELPERYFDAVTAVSGSGPAYVFYFVQMWEDAARALGLPDAIARRAVRRTLEGSARLLQASGEPAAVLVGKVASKRGTTEAALTVLARRAVSAHFAQALRAAAKRSKELSCS